MGLERFLLRSLFLVICVLGSVLECELGAGNNTGRPVWMDDGKMILKNVLKLITV